MTNKQLVALGVRLFCVWLAIYTLRELPSLWIFNEGQFHDPGVAIGVIIYTVILIAIVVALWIFPLTIARTLLPHSAQKQATSFPSAEQMQIAGFCLLGLWLLTQAVPGLAFEAVMFHLYTRTGSTLELRPQDYAALVEKLVQLVLAAWMLLDARGLLGLLRWARSAGSSGRAAGGGA